MVVELCATIGPIRTLSTVLLLAIRHKAVAEGYYVMSILHQLLLTVQLLGIKLGVEAGFILKTALLQLLSILSFGQIALRKFILGLEDQVQSAFPIPMFKAENPRLLPMTIERLTGGLAIL